MSVCVKISVLTLLKSKSDRRGVGEEVEDPSVCVYVVATPIKPLFTDFLSPAVFGVYSCPW